MPHSPHQAQHADRGSSPGSASERRPFLEIRGLADAVDQKTILDRLDLTIAEGEIHALLGANGSRKTTLAYAVMGCEGYAPTAGEVRFAGTNLLPLPTHERARLGITLHWQEPARFEGLTARQHLAAGAPGRVPASGARGHVDCKEILKDRAHASAIPLVKVFHPDAKVTHEAAISSVDGKEVGTLIARGLTPEEAVEMIVSGILR